MSSIQTGAIEPMRKDPKRGIGETEACRIQWSDQVGLDGNPIEEIGCGLDDDGLARDSADTETELIGISAGGENRGWREDLSEVFDKPTGAGIVAASGVAAGAHVLIGRQ